MEEKYKLVYNEAVKYLYEIKPKEITEDNFKKYFYVKEKPRTKKDINEMIFGSLQNYQGLPNIIKFNQNKEIFKEILLDFDSDLILKKYKSYEELLKVFVKELDYIDISRLDKQNNSWTKYSKGIISACEFMTQFNNQNEFDKFVNLFTYNESTAEALPMLLSNEIYGIGFALACDFLKELGYDQYPKPDVHLIDVFSELGLSSKDQYDCYKSIIKMAKAVNETPYTVDKVFWLICSGNFYEDNIKIGIHKKQFIDRIKNM